MISLRKFAISFNRPPTLRIINLCSNLFRCTVKGRKAQLRLCHMPHLLAHDNLELFLQRNATEILEDEQPRVDPERAKAGQTPSGTGK